MGTGNAQGFDLRQVAAGLRRMARAGYPVQCWYLDGVEAAARADPDHPCSRRVLLLVDVLRPGCSGV